MSVANIESPDKFESPSAAKRWLKEQGYKPFRQFWINQQFPNRGAELIPLPASGKASVRVFLQA